MTISIIIVNYNVKYFLEQCLYSLRRSVGVPAPEVIVVDNDSTDGSIDHLAPLFPEVQFVRNRSNTGFARACNQGAAMARGDLVLFLNPDTLVAEESLAICSRFFQEHEEAGALGVRMVDGSGRFLKESKRSFPSPLTSMYKLVGLSSLFPSSPVFSRYHLGHLDPHKDHEVDVLAGAFMMVRKDVLQQVGYFDETFFMYGEDVDLSYRIQKAGYRNYYTAQTEIIHFKGESTKRGSLNYVRMFYSAMSIFVKKHYGGARAGIFHYSIQFAILARAAVAALAKFVRFIGLPFIDAMVILLSFWLVKEIWVNYIRPDVVYDERLLWLAFPAFTFMYLVTSYYAGLYNKYYRQKDLIRSTLVATLVVLAFYALLPEEYRFSRGILFFGALVAFLLISVVRWIMLRVQWLWPSLEEYGHASILIAGTETEFREAAEILEKTGRSETIIGRLSINKEENALAPLAEIDRISAALYARELVICLGSFSYAWVIGFIQERRRPLRIRFHAAGSESIVGSDSSGTSGEAISSGMPFKLGQANYRRVKRLIDVVSSTGFILLFPIAVFSHAPLRFLKHCFWVALGKNSWIGYASGGGSLPMVRRGIIACNGLTHDANKALPAESLYAIDRWYAQEYDPLYDIKLIFKQFRFLGGE